jgi:hypothetical protein
MNGEANIMRLEARIERLQTEVTEIKSRMTTMPLAVETSIIKWLGATILWAVGAFVVTACVVETAISARSKERKIETPAPSAQTRPHSG